MFTSEVSHRCSRDWGYMPNLPPPFTKAEPEGSGLPCLEDCLRILKTTPIGPRHFNASTAAATVCLRLGHPPARSASPPPLPSCPASHAGPPHCPRPPGPQGFPRPPAPPKTPVAPTIEPGSHPPARALKFASRASFMQPQSEGARQLVKECSKELEYEGRVKGLQMLLDSAAERQGPALPGKYHC